MQDHSLSATSLPIGRYFGIPMRMHFTFLLYLILQFKQFANPVVGFLLAAGFALSIILHEYGHALAARHFGGWPEEVVLWQLGGMAVCREPWSNLGSIALTAGGPLVSLALALFFFGTANVLQNTPDLAPSGAHYVASQLARFNWLVLLFNLIPAFPMDGGRFLRDLLAFQMGRESATDMVLTLSRFIAVAAVVAGLVLANTNLLMLSVFCCTVVIKFKTYGYITIVVPWTN